MKLRKRKIKEKLDFLHSKLPKYQTAVNEFYALPKSLARKVIKTNFSQDSLQELSDNIGAFLGLLNFVKVTIGIESSDYMLATGSDVANADRVGFYKVLGGYNREIQLTKKFRFKFKHILAILAHESVHHYLYHHNVFEPDEKENEILTDITAAYLGLGHLLIKGYQPIQWTSDVQYYIFSTTYKINTLRIGYVSPGSIRYAIAATAKLRRLHPKEVLSKLAFADRINVYLRLLPYIRRLKKQEKKKTLEKRIIGEWVKKTNGLVKRIDKITSTYNRIKETMENVAKKGGSASIPREDSSLLVGIANKLYTGETDSEIQRLQQKVNFMKNHPKQNSDELVRELDILAKTLFNWEKLTDKYR